MDYIVHVSGYYSYDVWVQGAKNEEEAKEAAKIYIPEIKEMKFEQEKMEVNPAE